MEAAEVSLQESPGRASSAARVLLLASPMWFVFIFLLCWKVTPGPAGACPPPPSYFTSPASYVVYHASRDLYLLPVLEHSDQVSSGL